MAGKIYLTLLYYVHSSFSMYWITFKQRNSDTHKMVYFWLVIIVALISDLPAF